jgi:hypothetical protein
MVIVVAVGDHEECVVDISRIPRNRHATAWQFILMTTTTMVDATDKIPIPTTTKIVPSKKLLWFHWCSVVLLIIVFFLCWLFVRSSCAKNEDTGFPGKILFGGTRTRYGRITERVACRPFYILLLYTKNISTTLMGSQKNGTGVTAWAQFTLTTGYTDESTTAIHIPVINATLVQFIICC